MTANPPAPYATDEDVALRASSDFLLLCPKDQKIAGGSDGVLTAASPWTLFSASVDFQAHGAQPGQLVLLVSPGSCLRPGGELFVVSAAAPGTVLLRRKGQPDGVGMPPCPPNGMTGVEFSIATLAPQIATASDDLNRRFGLAPASACAAEPVASSWPGDAAELRDATVLTVLSRQYLDASRQIAGPADGFAAKAERIKAELDDLLARLVIHRRRFAAAGSLDAPSTRFSTRMSR